MHTKYFQTGGLTIHVESEIPMNQETFHQRLKPFETNRPGTDNVIIRHFFSRTLKTTVSSKDKIYFKRPWAIYNKNGKIIYEWITKDITAVQGCTFFRKLSTNKAHTEIDIYNDQYLESVFKRGRIEEITLLPTDQVLLSRVLGYHHGCLIHSMGMNYNENGYLFIGHSGAGKTTLAEQMKPEAVILHDDRNIIRRINNEYRLYGTWRHSRFCEISSSSAPLKGIFILNQSKENRIVALSNPKHAFVLLMDHLITSLITKDWMEATMDLIEDLSKQINIYQLYFDKSGEIKEIIDNL